jgi:hypothetical protein
VCVTRTSAERQVAPNLLAWLMHMTTVRLFLLPVVLLAALLAGCSPTAEPLERLDDPKEILEEALRTTAELKFVHAKVDAALAGGAEMLGAESATLEGDLDLGQREFHATLTANGGSLGQQQAEVLLVGTDMFTRTTGLGVIDDSTNGKWQRMPIDPGSDPRSGIPATPAIAVALKEVLSDPGISTELEGMAPCGESQCYRVTATIAPEVTWKALNGGLLGGEPRAETGPPDPAVPEIALDILVDEATRRLVSVKTTIGVQGMTADLGATFSNQDVEFDLLPPSPDQVVDANDTFGGGSGATPAPMAPGVDPGVVLEEVGASAAPTQ